MTIEAGSNFKREPLKQTKRKEVSPLLLPHFALLTIFVLGVAVGCKAAEGQKTPTSTVGPIPTSVFEPHNVPWINFEIKDRNGDGVYDWTDARAQNGKEWVPGLDMNGQRERKDGTSDPNEPFRITVRDVELIQGRVCTLPVLPKHDFDGNGHVTQADVDIVEDHVGDIVPEADNPNVRLDELRGIIIDGNENDPAKRNHRVVFDDVMGTDPDCEK